MDSCGVDYVDAVPTLTQAEAIGEQLCAPITLEDSVTITVCEFVEANVAPGRRDANRCGIGGAASQRARTRGRGRDRTGIDAVSRERRGDELGGTMASAASG
jgi:hypothetical protein